MNEVVAALAGAIGNLDSAARQLVDRHSNESDLLPALEGFIHACKCACTANIHWRSDRLQVLLLIGSGVANASVQSSLRSLP